MSTLSVELIVKLNHYLVVAKGRVRLSISKEQHRSLIWTDSILTL